MLFVWPQYPNDLPTTVPIYSEVIVNMLSLQYTTSSSNFLDLMTFLKRFYSSSESVQVEQQRRRSRSQRPHQVSENQGAAVAHRERYNFASSRENFYLEMCILFNRESQVFTDLAEGGIRVKCGWHTNTYYDANISLNSIFQKFQEVLRPKS